MLIYTMLCYKTELIKTLKYWNLIDRKIIGVTEPEKMTKKSR